jgi:hypothetical protein
MAPLATVPFVGQQMPQAPNVTEAANRFKTPQTLARWR